MPQNFGATFKYLRENRQVSLNALADEVVSKGALSKFENNVTDLSTQRFFHILAKINVDPAEFMTVLNHFTPAHLDQLQGQMQQFAVGGNIPAMKELIATEKQTWEATGNQFSQLNYLMCQCMLASVTGQQIAKKISLRPLIDYLFRCETWGYYELLLYGNAISQLSLAMIDQFSKILLTKVAMYNPTSGIYETAIITLINTVDIFLSHGAQTRAAQTLAILERQNLYEPMMLERILIKFYRGILQVQDGQQKSGNDLIQGSLTALRFSNCTHFAEAAKSLLTKLGLD
ncbi:MAG: Rgg/GadR/MutR family transcriptional regulator [Schleiferilactobacillus harbinensis]|nr:Rgg/GadR/MutR family transcriptional regulator [Schleiferilactobacillus harbinensis]MCI1913683.1 Rgg/GadR/MutR family transcriptional regulator [Schleiferilactobacillus harbinensis]